MEALVQEFNRDQPVNILSWLWDDTDLSDVTCKLLIPLAKPAGAFLAYLDHEEDPASAFDDNQHPPEALDASVLITAEQTDRSMHESAAEASIQPLQLLTNHNAAASPGFHVFHLHSTVLCSNSAYFRARVTSAVGMSCLGSKRSRGETMEEVMEADEREAAASVLYFFYTSKLRAQDSASCSASFLLQMMKVRPV